MEMPKWYVTPTEFSALVVATMEEIGYFKQNEPAHPEDIQVAFETVSKAVVSGMSFAAQRMR